MREILFRGKDDNNNWCYGYAIIGKRFKWASILPIDTIDDAPPMFDECEVELDTVGQYTGLTDKNGTKIFEGDIVEMHYFFENHDPNTLGMFEDENYIKGYLKCDELGLVLIDKNQVKYRVSDYVQEPCEELEVIGNIYDNPELLEGL